MLWVQIPPELLSITPVLVEQRSARLPVTQEIVGSNPIWDACNIARYANRQSGEAQTFVIVCEFDSGHHPEGGPSYSNIMRRLGIGEPKWL